MDLDPLKTSIVGGVAGLLTLAVRYAWLRAAEWFEVRIAAANERSRRREIKRQRRESSGPKFIRPSSKPEAVPETYDDEITDMHELVELEREAKRKKKRPGERAPRRGTHHDGEDG